MSVTPRHKALLALRDEQATELLSKHVQHEFVDAFTHDYKAGFDAALELLLPCVEALERTRGQWIHSVNADKCLAALTSLDERLHITSETKPEKLPIDSAEDLE
jgi:hypothetical protein